MSSSQEIAVNINEKNNENKSGEEKEMEFLKTQEDNVVVIDVSEQPKEVEASEPENKKKHVNIFKQFLIPRVYITAVVAYIIYFVCNIAINIIISFIAPDVEGTSTNQETLNEYLHKNTSIIIILTVIIGPIYEEIIFRLCIFKVIWIIGEKLGKNNKVIRIFIIILAFVISSFIFAFSHFGLNIYTLINEFAFFPTYFLMGLTFAGAYYYDGYFLAGLLTHILNNAIATSLIFLYN